MSSHWVFNYNHSRSKIKKKEDNFSLACLLQSFYSFREKIWLLSFFLQKRTHWMSSVTLCIFEGAGRGDDQETMSLLTYRCHQASWHRYKGVRSSIGGGGGGSRQNPLWHLLHLCIISEERPYTDSSDMCKYIVLITVEPPESSGQDKQWRYAEPVLNDNRHGSPSVVFFFASKRE